MVKYISFLNSWSISSSYEVYYFQIYSIEGGKIDDMFSSWNLKFIIKINSLN
jgi:hypothetical protein